jgi:hypothetical protein
MSMALTNLAHIMRQRGQLERAKDAIDESMTCLHDSGALNYRGEQLLEMGWIELALGNRRNSVNQFHKALQYTHEIGDVSGLWDAIEGRALSSASLAGWEASTVHGDLASEPVSAIVTKPADSQTLQHITQLLAVTQSPDMAKRRDSRRTALIESCRQWLRTTLGEDVFTHCWNEGQRLQRDAAISLALQGLPSQEASTANMVQ